MSPKLGLNESLDPRRTSVPVRRTKRRSIVLIAVLLVICFIFSSFVPLAMNMNANTAQAEIQQDASDASASTGTSTVTATATTTGGAIALGTLSANLTVVTSTGMIKVYAQTYYLTVDYRTGFVTYIIHPYFTNDYIMYRRVNPSYAGDGTTDQYKNTMDWVSMTISKWTRTGSTVTFLESCPQFSLTQGFTFFKDYMELNTTYAPGTSKVITSYFVGLYTSSGSMISMVSDGKYHRYVPGYSETWPKENGLGGWYPSFQMFAPAFDMRAPSRTLGVEWGYSDTEAYLNSPVWMKDCGGGGPSVFSLKYTSTDCVVPDVASGKVQTFHQFIRPYQYTDGQAQGHDAGYAQWVSAKIAKQWGYVSTPQFPLTFNNMNPWSTEITNWVQSSQITVAMQSTNADQVNFHYKSAQQMTPAGATMPQAWQLYDSPGHPFKNAAGYNVASASSPAYRNYLINQDQYNSWWWNSKGVFFDEVNVINGANKLLSDYNTKSEFIYDGYLDLVKEARAAHWSFVITNPTTALLHLAMVSNLSLIEGWQAVPSYNNDMKAHVISTMDFVNNIPKQYRPHIDVYQNYVAGSDQAAVYSAVFGAARYGFSVELLSYSSYSSQIHNLAMAEKMFKAMGASRHQDPTVPVATLDTSSEGSTLTTDKQMVVLTGANAPTLTITKVFPQYMLTNLYGSAKAFTLTLPSGTYTGSQGITVQSVTSNANGSVTIHGTITAEATGLLKKA
jgi:hypothetical protein